ncbi:helix-turn-helix transcriptional regulator [Streptomyces mirabilis]|uniref:helix-turn-helix transcriptional regulator n=1 Tax=Streptomyces mirabilis TaxID=68239 RepID=UPI0036ED1316
MHYHYSHPALHELASAAARSGHYAEAARIVDGAARSLENVGRPSPRRAALVHLSRAALAPPDEAESHFTEALEASILARRPFERARTLLQYGEWLRRRHRILEAGPSLAEAEGIFRRLGAPPWAARVQNELRAAGTQGNTPEPDALAALTPQQQQIVRLAARGPTNREIAEKLYLSPRTVSSHLYRAFPKPGITVRSRLRDVLEAHTAGRGSA